MANQIQQCDANLDLTKDKKNTKEVKGQKYEKKFAVLQEKVAKVEKSKVDAETEARGLGNEIWGLHKGRDTLAMILDSLDTGGN